MSGANGGKGRVTRRRPVAVDLFAGAGGLSLGFEQAGFDVAAAVEIDPIHAATHRYNFPDCATIPKPIAEVSGRELRSVSGIGDREVDIVVGGPPCQGFSFRGAFTSPRPIHYARDRCVTIREMARLHGFSRLVPLP